MQTQSEKKVIVTNFFSYLKKIIERLIFARHKCNPVWCLCRHGVSIAGGEEKNAKLPTLFLIKKIKDIGSKEEKEFDQIPINKSFCHFNYWINGVGDEWCSHQSLIKVAAHRFSAICSLIEK